MKITIFRDNPHLNENKIPLVVKLKIPPRRIDTEGTGVETFTNTTEDA